MVKSYHCPILLFLAICFLPLGCFSSEHRELMPHLREYQEKDVLIGSLSGTYFEYVDFVKSPKPELLRDARHDYQRTGVPNAPSQQATDGRTTMCDSKQCSIADPRSSSTKVLFSSAHVVTPLYWSPDNRMLLFVKDLAKLRIPLRCGWDDEHDIVVYDVDRGQEQIVTTVCGGYPYKQLGWYVGNIVR